MRKILSVLLAAMMAMLLALPALADEAGITEWAKQEAEKLPEDARVVNVFTWEYYIPDEVVDLFQSATGIKVNYSSFSDNETMLAKLQSAQGQYDLIVCSDYIIETMVQQTEKALAGEEGAQALLTAIDKSRLPNYANIDPAYQGQYFDPQDAYSIPYTNTVPLLVYNPDAVDFEVTGYADLWREEFAGKLVLVDDMRNVLGITQKKLGMSYNETDPEKMEQVRQELLKLKPNVAALNADTPHYALISGDAIAGYMFGSQIVAAKEELPQLKHVYPTEGLGFGIDSLVVPAEAPHLDATYIFLNFLLDGEISAQASGYINYGNCNQAAAEFMSEAYKANTEVNVPSEYVQDAEMIRSVGEATTLYDQIWTEFKAN